MPFTPFHMGAACVVKAVAGRHFSMTVFGFSQVAMDVQPLYHMVRGEGIIHGFSHTFLGATLIGVLTVLAGKPLCQVLLRFWAADPGELFLKWLRGPHIISWPTTIVSAFVGTYSHVLIDSLVSFDVRPFAPFSDWSPLLDMISMGALTLVLIGTGILGFIGMVIVYMVETR
jgi:membrane-bound metal-dependent hydrolase YbcI (DUF457 family)